MSKHLKKIREAAKYQDGIFARFQVDVPDDALHYHTQNESLERLQTGIYRLTDRPLSDHEEYIVAHLWSREEGVLSHETALNIHNLSDVLPKQIHLTVPEHWRDKRREIPDRYRLHYADLPDEDIEWFESLRITSVERTLKAVADAGMDPDLVEQALDQAVDRGIVPSNMERRLLRYLISSNAR